MERVLKDLKPHMADVLDQLARDTRFYIERRPELTAHGWLRAQRWKIPRAETGEAPWVPPPKKNGHNGHNGKDRGIAWEVGWLGDPDNAGKQPPWGKSPAPELLSFLRGELERCRTGSANWAAAAARLKQAMGEL
ncbi:MAG TPA: hypothetical protein VES65_11405 [Solirubrobacteraceae bacterium]|nr:hypothetical protein [Solirubrobacteraceae bacterium]